MKAREGEGGKKKGNFMKRAFRSADAYGGMLNLFVFETFCIS